MMSGLVYNIGDIGQRSDKAMLRRNVGRIKGNLTLDNHDHLGMI